MKTYLLAIGVMTGNSLDGADTVLSKFDEDGQITDLCSASKKSPAVLTNALRALRQVINECKGEMLSAERIFDEKARELLAKERTEFESLYGALSFETVQRAYILFVADAVRELLKKARGNFTLATATDLSRIDIVGLHGQTCAHCPPSIAKTRDPRARYTVQIGSGQLLADELEISVVYDFRSDDLMNGGEGAPLAPVHHQHLAAESKRLGRFPLAFCNGGNTGNVSVISQEISTGKLVVMGWDTGPFNNYPDKLIQKERGFDYDDEAQIGRAGSIQLGLLQTLFDTAVVTKDGENFLLKSPPKSSDPEWYRMLGELTGEKPLDGKVLSFEDRVRTAEYFAVYAFFHSLMLLPKSIQVPSYFAYCGGGWKNPLCVEHFRALLFGDELVSPILPQHRQQFLDLRERMKVQPVPRENRSDTKEITCDPSESFGFDGTAMEARIFADAAVCRIKGEPFTFPEGTGTSNPTVAGILRYPFDKKHNATSTLRAWLTKYNSEFSTPEFQGADARWSRASAGWSQKTKITRS